MWNAPELLDVLNEAQELLSLEGNDFAWSGWASSDDAVREIASYISLIKGGVKPDGTVLSALFAPTGPIQEVSLSGGWAEKFLELAKRFDRAFGES